MEVFPIIPASAKPLWFLGVICALLALILIALAYTAYSSRHARVELGGGSIRLVGDFWGRTIPLQALIPSQARILDLHKGSDLSPKRRTLGTGLPGYASGWFRLRNGEKALVYLTSWSQVVYVPTTAGYSLLLSVREPERFVTALGGSTS
jgi:hypothetical protein